MKKKELRALRVIKATPLLIQAAAKDPITKEVHGFGSHKWTTESYKYKFFLRAMVENNILKVAIFQHEHLDTGGKLPTYELFLLRDERRWITYDRVKNKWRTAKIYLLSWSWSQKEVWIRAADANVIQKYLGTKEAGYNGICEYQQQIEKENLMQRYKNETDAWDQAMAQIPPVPKDWKHWAAKTGIPEHYIYYEYVKKGATLGYCTHCRKDVPIKTPHYNAETQCACCGQKVRFKSLGRAGRVYTENHNMYLLQRCRDGFVVREFRGYTYYPKGLPRDAEIRIHEIRRTIYDKTAQNPRSFYWGVYKQRDSRWIGCSPCSIYGYNENGHVYARTLPDLEKKELRRTGLVAWIRSKKRVDPEWYLAYYQHVPLLEQIQKAGLPRLTDECFSSTDAVTQCIVDRQATSLTKALGINAQQLKRLRAADGGHRFLRWLHHEKALGKPIDDEVINWFAREKIPPKEIQFIQGKMSSVQIMHYIQRQMKNSRMTSGQVLRTWEDYLSMAEDLGINTNDEIVYRARNLHQRHNELVRRRKQQDDIHLIEKMEKKFPLVEEVCKTLKKYEYTDGKYVIVSPTGIGDIIREGRILNHCISDRDRYYDRIARREAYILFLRRAINPQEPYYTLEIEPDATIRQKRTVDDEQLEDIELAMPFLTEWQKVIAEKLSAEDRELSRKSRLYRAEEFEELKRTKKIVHFGAMQGKKLLDVLAADLLENEFTSAA